MFCPKCGYNYGDESSNFCPKCGAPLNNQLTEPEEEEDTFVKKPFRDECGNRISDSSWNSSVSAYSTPHRKSPGCLIAFAVAVVLLFLFVIFPLMAANSETVPSDIDSIDFTVVAVDELYADLDENAMRAKETWNGVYIAVVGQLDSIDSDGDYLTIKTPGAGFTLDRLQCSIPSTLHNTVMNFSVDDNVIVYAQIDMVSDILGYHSELLSIESLE